jgi:hypothetical protein
MKFLIREKKKNFLEAKAEDGKLKLTGRNIDPSTLINFGTDMIDLDGCNSDNDLLPREYIKEMENLGIDYLFISPESQSVDHAQAGKNLVAITAYFVK